MVIVISATVDPATPDDTTLTNTTSATSPTDDPNPANNSDTETTHVDTEADLDIDKSGPLTATAGDPAGFDYTIRSTTTARPTTPVASPSATRWRAA